MAVSTIDPNGLNIGQIGGTRNRIINGAMVIDQRNAGASIVGNNGVFPVDRWVTTSSQASKYDIGQNEGAVTPPAGFTNYLGVTSSSAYTVGASETFSIRQLIEGYNVADLGWGTANAQSVTLSFWVRSSLTGTFGGTLKASGGTRTYPFTYTISASNTWEQKAITVAGDTTGTWLTTNGIGLQIQFGLGVGATLSGTAGAWSGSNFNSATGATSVVGTSGATWYITGVQLEAGDTATPFEHRSYGQELALCQRYYQVVDVNGTVSFRWAAGYGNTGNMAFLLPTPMRSSASFTSLTTLTSRNLYNQATDSNVTSGGMTASLSIGRPTAIQIFVGSVSGSLGGSGGDPFIIGGGSETLFAFDAEL